MAKKPAKKTAKKPARKAAKKPTALYPGFFKDKLAKADPKIGRAILNELSDSNKKLN